MADTINIHRLRGNAKKLLEVLRHHQIITITESQLFKLKDLICTKPNQAQLNDFYTAFSKLTFTKNLKIKFHGDSFTGKESNSIFILMILERLHSSNLIHSYVLSKQDVIVLTLSQKALQLPAGIAEGYADYLQQIPATHGTMTQEQNGIHNALSICNSPDIKIDKMSVTYFMNNILSMITQCSCIIDPDILQKEFSRAAFTQSLMQAQTKYFSDRITLHVINKELKPGEQTSDQQTIMRFTIILNLDQLTAYMFFLLDQHTTARAYCEKYKLDKVSMDNLLALSLFIRYATFTSPQPTDHSYRTVTDSESFLADQEIRDIIADPIAQSMDLTTRRKSINIDVRKLFSSNMHRNLTPALAAFTIYPDKKPQQHEFVTTPTISRQTRLQQQVMQRRKRLALQTLSNTP